MYGSGNVFSIWKLLRANPDFDVLIDVIEIRGWRQISVEIARTKKEAEASVF
ncbi:MULTISPECIES: hypothetical protein [unclassified Pseudomonas]|jgi:hypothetical protein|uniref:hypothetical protein n=1 Tax=unclassified Pseudomonas TaxID=196821 RepID=UPI000AABBAA6|nr:MULTISPECIES: hypothetical protein [unclassified Pseudomonas]WPN49619.1 hypothetical protein QMK58_13505 [Pseudomonas sp. P8_241]